MNDSILDFEIDPISEFTQAEDFMEFCSAVDSIRAYHESMELYIEAVRDPKITDRGVAAANTKELAGFTGQAVAGVVDAKASLYNTAAKAALKLLGKGVLIFKWMLGNAIRMINNISDLGSKIGNIPESVFTKIRGDIQLYITAGDLEVIYNDSVINRIDTFITTMDLFTKGDTWGQLFKKIVRQDDYKLSKEEINCCKNLKKIYQELNNIKFNPTTINMKDEKAKKMYFSKDGNISFTDLHGKHHNDNYYDTLKVLIQDLTSRKKELEDLQSAFGEKMDRAHMEQTWAKLSGPDQATVSAALKHSSGVIMVIGEMLKYVSIDIKTLDTTVDKILKSTK